MFNIIMEKFPETKQQAISWEKHKQKCQFIVYTYKRCKLFATTFGISEPNVFSVRRCKSVLCSTLITFTEKYHNFKQTKKFN